MAYVKVTDLHLSYPVNLESASIRRVAMDTLTGGFLRRGDTATMMMVDAIRGISFEARDGDRIGLIGHNGAGKTTLLKVLSNIYSPTSGSVVVDGKLESLIDVGFGLEPEETGRENIRFILKLLGTPKHNLDEQIEEIADFTELGEFIDLPVRTYSAGMSTRLSFAISTSIEPEILLMDEVIGAGDIAFKDKASKRIEEIAENTKILFLASHVDTWIREWCNHVIWLEKGQIMGTGTPDEIWPQYEKHMLG